MKVKCIFIWIPWELHAFILPEDTSNFFSFKLCSVIHSSRVEPAHRPIFFKDLLRLPCSLPESNATTINCAALEQTNVLCLRTARRFTMKGCRCVREHAFSLSVSLRLSEGPLGTWWGRCGVRWKHGELRWGPLAGFFRGKEVPLWGHFCCGCA